MLLAVGTIGLVVGARFFGLIGYYSVPSGSMAPAIRDHGHVLVEGVSYLLGAPRRGDIVAYNTGEIAAHAAPGKVLEENCRRPR